MSYKNKIIIKFKGNKIKITNTPKFEITGDQEKFSINGEPLVVNIPDFKIQPLPEYLFTGERTYTDLKAMGFSDLDIVEQINNKTLQPTEKGYKVFKKIKKQSDLAERKNKKGDKK